MPINRLCARRHPLQAMTRPRIHQALLVALTLTALTANDLLAQPLDYLVTGKVTSVSGKTQQLQDAAAAVFVLTHGDLKQRGATDTPDALRNVPGLHVARVDATRRAVSARCCNGRFANKQLVIRLLGG